MTRGQGIKQAANIIRELKSISDNPEQQKRLAEIIEHLEFVGQFYC